LGINVGHPVVTNGTLWIVVLCRQGWRHGSSQITFVFLVLNLTEAGLTHWLITMGSITRSTQMTPSVDVSQHWLTHPSAKIINSEHNLKSIQNKLRNTEEEW